MDRYLYYIRDDRPNIPCRARIIDCKETDHSYLVEFENKSRRRVFKVSMATGRGSTRYYFQHETPERKKKWEDYQARNELDREYKNALLVLQPESGEVTDADKRDFLDWFWFYRMGAK